jgi:hypothetical protein
VVYRALPAEGLVVSARPGRLRPLVLVGAAAMVALATIGLVLASNLGAVRPTASPSLSVASASATPVPAARPFANGVMEPGQYVARVFVPNLDLQLADEWCGGPRHNQLQNNQFTGPDSLYLWTPGMAGSAIAPIAGEPCAGRQTAADAGYLELNHVEQVYAPTACADGATRSIGGSWDALVEYLTSRPGTSITNRGSDTFGGVVGEGFDVHVDKGTACSSSGAPVRAVLAFPTTILDVTGASRVAAVWWGEGQYLRIWVVDVDGRLVVVTIGHEGSSEPLNRDFLDRVYRVIRTIRFLPTS